MRGSPAFVGAVSRGKLSPVWGLGNALHPHHSIGMLRQDRYPQMFAATRPGGRFVGGRGAKTAMWFLGAGQGGKGLGKGDAVLLMTAATIVGGGGRGRGRGGGRAMCAGGGGESLEIEVEQKFNIDEGCADRVGRTLDFKGEKLIKDVYFDTKDSFPLTCTDHWLRLRDEKWELKQPISLPAGVGGGTLDTYREITDVGEVASALEALLDCQAGALTTGGGGGLEERLQGVGCVPFATVVSRRRKYEGGGIAVDLDEVVEPAGMDYSIGEVEVMARGEEGVAEAQGRIEKFMKDHGIKTQAESGKVALGKVLSIIHRSDPAHFDMLRKALGHKHVKLTQV